MYSALPEGACSSRAQSWWAELWIEPPAHTSAFKAIVVSYVCVTHKHQRARLHAAHVRHAASTAAAGSWEFADFS